MDKLHSQYDVELKLPEFHLQFSYNTMIDINRNKIKNDLGFRVAKLFERKKRELSIEYVVQYLWDKYDDIKKWYATKTCLKADLIHIMNESDLFVWIS